jgi:hypothetical protein
MRLEDELRRVRSRLDRMERQMREEIRNVHKQYRREIVLYRDPDDKHPERSSWTFKSSR